MATLQLQYPDEEQARLVEVFCFGGGWTSDMGITKAAFAKAQVAELVRARAHELERHMLRQQALATVADPPTLNVT